MNVPNKADDELEDRLSRRLLDVARAEGHLNRPQGGPRHDTEIRLSIVHVY
jgi:hypothetical protein